MYASLHDETRPHPQSTLDEALRAEACSMPATSILGAERASDGRGHGARGYLAKSSTGQGR